MEHIEQKSKVPASTTQKEQGDREKTNQGAQLWHRDQIHPKMSDIEGEGEGRRARLLQSQAKVWTSFTVERR